WGHPEYKSIASKLRGNVHIISAEIYKDLKKKLEIEPSSGLIVIEMLRRNPKIKSINLYGFDFFTSGHSTRTNVTKHIYKGTFPHNAIMERNYILDIVKSDKRFKINGYEQN